MDAPKASEGSRLGWRMPFCGALAAVLLFVPLIVSISGTLVFYVFAIAPSLIVTGVCVLIYAAVRKKLQIALMVTIFWVASALLFSCSIPIHIVTKWLLWSREYKNEVLAEPAPKSGDLKHIEWDGWGWGAQDISVFLVFDPEDSLSGPAKNRQSGKLGGIPCQVSFVQRMDSHWYLVFFDFYVDQSSWDRC